MAINDALITKLSNCIRSIGMDCITNAKSGHPGMVLGMADIMTVLYAEFLRFNPNDPKWSERDRFILSNGHGSAMLYTLLYLSGYQDIDVKDLKNFRKINSKTAGHPEYGMLSGIEATTGPLGQGVANAVGMAIAAKKSGHSNKIYCTVGDGCLMEGISYEAMSLAGHLALNNLIVIFDDNSITIDGKTSISFSENHEMRFKSQNWNVIKIDGHNINQIRKALAEAQNSAIPTVIIAKTIIGYGSKNQNTHLAHGNPLTKEEIVELKQKLNVQSNEFEIPSELLQEWRMLWKRNEHEYKKIQNTETKSYADFFASLRKKSNTEQKPIAIRKAFGKIIDECYQEIPNLIGGSADLSDSTCVKTKHSKDITSDDFSGNFINYGIREHGMAGIINGISLYGCFMPFGSTFFAFSDYMRPAIRMAAMSNINSIFVFTHDSIGVGEDGPTHQPIEHLASLNAIPNLITIRPSCELETAEAIEIAIESKEAPTAILCSRQNVDQIFATNISTDNNNTKLGAYYITETAQPECIIIASGSEVGLAYQVYLILKQREILANLVSMPCCNLFDKQSKEYKQKILKNNEILKIGIEAGSIYNLAKYLSTNDLFFGLDSFGHSAPANDVYSSFGLTPDNIAQKIYLALKK